MKLLTYRIDQREYNLRSKLEFMSSLKKDVLGTDALWHFFLDPDGATLRFQPQYHMRVLKWLKKNAKNLGFKYRKRLYYDPKKHEYYGISYLGEDILPLFHDLSVLATQYPPYVMVRPVMERLNHGLVNMTGNHDFASEAELYLRMGYVRARMVGHKLSVPNFIRKLFFKLVELIEKLDGKVADYDIQEMAKEGKKRR